MYIGTEDIYIYIYRNDVQYKNIKVTKHCPLLIWGRVITTMLVDLLKTK